MSEQDLTLIEAYVKGNMTADEKAAFEARLKSDPELSSALSDRQKMEAYLTHRTSVAFTLDDLRHLNQQNFPEDRKKSPLIPVRTIISIAASILFVLAAYFLYNTYTSPSSPEELYQAFAEPIPLDLTTRGENACADDQLIMDLYTAGKYSEVLPLLQNCTEAKPDNSLLKMARGYCQMELGDTEAAGKTFEEILEEESLLKDEAAWNLALTYVRAGELERAKEVLEEYSIIRDGIDRPRSKKQSREEKLLKDLQKLIDRK